MINNYPDLRFPGFKDEWQFRKIDELLKKYSEEVKVEDNGMYREIGIKSHGKGLFHKDLISGTALGSKRVYKVKPDMFVLNIVFAWEQAVAKTTEAESGMIASHRFPMFKANNDLVELDFIVKYFLTDTGKKLLNIASPGGAGRNKTLGQDAFKKLKLLVPTLDEQKKIITFLNLLDNWIENLQKQQEYLNRYKRGLITSVFSNKLRLLTADKENKLDDWEKKNLFEVLVERKVKNSELKYNEVFSVAKEKGIINQIEHLGRSYAASDLSGYKVVYPDDIVYTKSPTANFPFGVIKQNLTGRIGLVSTLYAVYKPTNKYIGYILQQYFNSPANTFNYLNPLVHKGAKNTMNISNTEFLKGAKINLPTSMDEQQNIARFFMLIEQLINIKQEEIKAAVAWRKKLINKLYI